MALVCTCGRYAPCRHCDPPTYQETSMYDPTTEPPNRLTEAEREALRDDLLPAESMALTVALAQVRRGESPAPNIATACVLALGRVVGRYDWIQEEDS